MPAAKPSAAKPAKRAKPAPAAKPKATGARAQAAAKGTDKPRKPAKPSESAPAKKTPTPRGKPAARNADALLDALAKAHPEAPCALHHRNAFELLVATILSAQCTDKRVNLVTPALFARFPTPAAMARAELGELEALVASTGFFRAKSKSLLGTSQALVTRFGGEVPKTLAELITLPGVARKTANVVLGTAYRLCEGVVVDTHVMRLSQRLGLSRATDAVRIERDLMAVWPRAAWIEGSLRLIVHGRQICLARAPKCGICPLAGLCPSAGRVGLKGAKKV